MYLTRHNPRTFHHIFLLHRSTFCSLEQKRQVARTAQQDLIARKQSALWPNAVSDHNTAVAHCSTRLPGSLWRARSACKRLPPATESPLLTFPQLLLHSNAPVAAATTPRCLDITPPSHLHFPANLTVWSWRAVGKFRWTTEVGGGPPVSLGCPRVTYEVGDASSLIPDPYGCVGKEEIVK